MSATKDTKIKVIIKCPVCDHQEVREFVCPECESYMHVEEQLEDTDDLDVVEEKEEMMDDVDPEDEIDDPDEDLGDLKDFTITDDDDMASEEEDPYKAI